MKYKKMVLVFPGQGSQYPGMGKEFYDAYDFVRDIYDEANEVLEYDLAEKCFRKHKFGPKIISWTDLDKTIHTQPAVLTTSYACYKVLEHRLSQLNSRLSFSFLAGHSLGEYTALVVSGTVDFRTCLKLVEKRAAFMTAAGKYYPGAGLMAVMDRENELDYVKMCDLCKSYDVYITLNNTTRQIVVGGSKKQLAEMAKELKKQGKMATHLKVEGPFHTPIMKPAANRFKRELDEIDFLIGRKPVIANVTTNAIVDPVHVRQELFEQIYQIVNWRGSVEKIIANGADMFVEVGPKKVLTNMTKDIDPSIQRTNVEDMASLEKTVAALTETDEE